MSGGFAFQIKVGGSNALRLYGSQALVRVKGEVRNSLGRAYGTGQELCPRDTNYMAEHMRHEITDEGFGYEMGFHAEDFVGHTNPVNGQPITSFYPLFTEFGTRLMSAQPCIIPAGETELPKFKRGVAEALKPTRSAQPPGRR